MTATSRRQLLKATAAAIATAASAPLKADFAPLRSLPVIVNRTLSTKSDYKKRAIADYAANMKPFGGALSAHGKSCYTRPPELRFPGFLMS